MGGSGEAVNYIRLRAKTKEQRNKLKKEINDLINQSSTAISVIALVEEPPKLKLMKPKPKTKRKAKRKAKRKKYRRSGSR
jgi:DNA-binding protein H-NS